MKKSNYTFTVTLTISTHSNGDALFQSTVLAAISVYAEDRTLLVLSTRPVLNFLLDAATEESLRRKEREGREERRKFSVYSSHKLNGRLHCQAEFK